MSQAASDRLTSVYILKGFEALNYDAIGIQRQDLSYGADFLKAAQLPWVSTNWKGDQFSRYKRIERGDRKLAFFSWLEPPIEFHGASGSKGRHKRTRTGLEVLKNNLAEAKSENALTVLTTGLNYEAALASLPLTFVDILIVKAASEKYVEPEMFKGALILRPGVRGLQLGRLDITFDSDNRIQSFKHQQIPMSPFFADSPRMAEWYTEYNDRVKQAYLKSVEIRKAIELGERNYVGADACKECHQSAYHVWSTSQHAKAFDSLALVNKAFDPNCITCHTVGFNKEGGYIDYEDTAYLTDVQCESCHGAGRKHITSNGSMATEQRQWPRKRICMQCHSRKHSPSFSLESYWSRISH